MAGTPNPLADETIHLLDKLVLGVERGGIEVAVALKLVEDLERTLRGASSDGLLEPVWPIIEDSKAELRHFMKAAGTPHRIDT